MVEGVDESGDSAEATTIHMIRLELQRLADNVERVGSLGQGLGELDARLDEIVRAW